MGRKWVISGLQVGSKYPVTHLQKLQVLQGGVAPLPDLQVLQMGYRVLGTHLQPTSITQLRPIC